MNAIDKHKCMIELSLLYIKLCFMKQIYLSFIGFLLKRFIKMWEISYVLIILSSGT